MGWRDFNKDFQQYRVRADLNQMLPVENVIVEQFKKDGKVLINKHFWRKLEVLLRFKPGEPHEHDLLIRRLIININGTFYSADRFLNRSKTQNKPKNPSYVQLDGHKKTKQPPQNRISNQFRDLNKFVKTKKMKWRNIKVEGVSIAKIGIIIQKDLMTQADQNFAKKQTQNSLVSLVAALLISVVIGFIGARLFSKPIEKLSKSTKTLAQGHYNIDPPEKGNDEIAQLGRDLYLLSQTLSSNLNAKNQWIADISHELRTPVAVIKAQIEAMLDGIRKPTDANLMVFAHQIEDLSKLINDLHELSMSDLGAMNYQFEQMDLSQAVINVINEHPHHEIEIENTIQDDILIYADQRRIEQLFRNLLQNTIKYSDLPAKVLLESKQHNKLISLNWHDSGPGVTDEQLKRLFERLYRAESSRNKKTGGSGLGLSICKNIVSAHQGDISVSHSPLGGVNITIEFPMELKHV